MLYKPAPTVGPISHPSPADANAISPIVMNGSSGTRLTSDSAAPDASAADPPVPHAAAPMRLQRTWILRRVLRIWKKVFQSRTVGCSAAAEVVEAGRIWRAAGERAGVGFARRAALGVSGRKVLRGREARWSLQRAGVAAGRAAARRTAVAVGLRRLIVWVWVWLERSWLVGGCFGGALVMSGIARRASNVARANVENDFRGPAYGRSFDRSARA